jgi:O-antigen ligase
MNQIETANGAIDAPKNRRFTVGDIKIKDIDIVLGCLLFFDPTGGIPNSFYTVIRYLLVAYLFIKYLNQAKHVRIPVIVLSVFSVALAFSTYANTHNVNRAISGFMFGIQILAFMLVYLDAAKRITFLSTIKILAASVFVFLLINDLMMVALPYDHQDSSTLYLLGNKFTVSYAHALFVGMLIVAWPKKHFRVLLIGLICAVMAYVSGSATGTTIVLLVTVLSLLPKPARAVVGNPIFVFALIAILNFLIWGTVNLFQNPYVQDFIVNVLGKSADMTGRQRLYDATFGFVAMKPLWGWGYLTDIYRDTFGYGNAQNGLFHMITQCGIAGSTLYFLGLFLAMVGNSNDGHVSFGIYSYLIAMVIGSAVEINLSTQFAFAIALICAANQSAEAYPE